MDYHQLRNFASAKIKLDEFFIEWVGSEVAKEMIKLSIEEMNAQLLETDTSGVVGRDLEKTSIMSNLSKVTQHERPGATQPPRSPTKKSPKKRTQADMHNTNPDTIKDICSASTDTVSLPDRDIDSNRPSSSRRPRSNFDSIPIFYTPGQSQHYQRLKPLDSEICSKKLTEIESHFKQYPNGIPVDKFVHVTKRICGVPSFFNLPLFKRINTLSHLSDLGASGKGIKRDVSAIKLMLMSC